MLLLADIFETFREVCITNYKLDPTHYVSSPQLSWDAMLKITEVELDLISDPEMFKMLDNGMNNYLFYIQLLITLFYIFLLKY